MRNDAWRMQLLICQGYVPAQSERTGYYSDKPKVHIPSNNFNF